MIFVKFFVRKGFNMPKSMFRDICLENGLDAKQVMIVANANGWHYFGHFGMELQDFIDLAFPAVDHSGETENEIGG